MAQVVCRQLGHRRLGSYESQRRSRPFFQNRTLLTLDIHTTLCTCHAIDNTFESLVLDECRVFSVSPLTREDIPQASVVITRAFAMSPQYIPIDECRRYCVNLLEHDDSEGFMLVGTMRPGPDCVHQAQSYLPEGQQRRVVATVSLSFCDKTRESFLSLKPPDNEPYLCNIAVDPSFRRQGLAKHMLRCAEEYCTSQGHHRIYLHVRLGDEAARNLYLSCGYEEIQSDRYATNLYKVVLLVSSCLIPHLSM